MEVKFRSLSCSFGLKITKTNCGHDCYKRVYYTICIFRFIYRSVLKMYTIWFMHHFLLCLYVDLCLFYPRPIHAIVFIINNCLICQSYTRVPIVSTSGNKIYLLTFICTHFTIKSVTLCHKYDKSRLEHVLELRSNCISVLVTIWHTFFNLKKPTWDFGVDNFFILVFVEFNFFALKIKS